MDPLLRLADWRKRDHDGRESLNERHIRESKFTKRVGIKIVSVYCMQTISHMFGNNSRDHFCVVAILLENEVAMTHTN